MPHLRLRFFGARFVPNRSMWPGKPPLKLSHPSRVRAVLRSAGGPSPAALTPARRRFDYSTRPSPSTRCDRGPVALQLHHALDLAALLGKIAPPKIIFY